MENHLPPTRLKIRFCKIQNLILKEVRKFFSAFQSAKPHVDHQAQAYVAPRRVMAETNGNAPKIANGTKPKWGGAEVCPRCDKSVRSCCHAFYKILFFTLFKIQQQTIFSDAI